MNEQDIRNEWQAKGFSFGIWVDPPGQFWRDFSHDVDELFMLVEGKVELTINGNSQQPTPGETILIPAHAKHTVENIGKTQSTWYYGYKDD